MSVLFHFDMVLIIDMHMIFKSIDYERFGVFSFNKVFEEFISDLYNIY